MPLTAQGQGGLQVLVVDDDADNAESTACLLGLWGHEARVAADGKTALLEVAARCPDLVLLDMGLPGGMDGWQVATRLRESAGPKPIVIAITGHGGEEARLRSQEAGVNLHLTKPVPLEVLQGLLRRFRTALAEDQRVRAPS